MKAALKSSIFLFFLEQLCYFNLSPQGDGNIGLMDHRHKLTNFNLSPQGDGNSSNRWFIGYRYNFNLSPQGDGNSRTFCRNLRKPSISTYPRKGTETQPNRRRGRKNLQISTYPRKGTETQNTSSLMKNIRFQLIPARGRKHFHLSIEIMMCIISTYPRKGTETALVNHLVPEVLDFNLSPQGDGNGTQTESLMIDLIFQLIPARGRKPLLHPVRAAGLNNFNLSPQNPLRRCAPALPKGELFQLPLPCTKLPLSGELARRKP